MVGRPAACDAGRAEHAIRRAVRVRAGTVADLPALRPLAAALADMYDRLWDPERAPLLWASLMGHGAGLLVAEMDAGGIVGAAGLTLTVQVGTAQPVAHLQWWYVVPVARPHAGLALLAAAEQWARQRGARALYAAVPDSARAGAMLRWFRQRGYAPVETWVKREWAANGPEPSHGTGLQ